MTQHLNAPMLRSSSLINLIVVIVPVTGTDYTYWSFTHSLQVNKAVSWGDIDIPVVDKEFSWLPCSYDTRVPSQSMERGRIIDDFDNHTVGYREFLFAWELKLNAKK